MRPCEHLSRRQRRETPASFCRCLFGLALALGATKPVQVVYVERLSNYWKLWPDVDMVGMGRLAESIEHERRFRIMHPPCGPWGCYHHVSHENRSEGIRAMRLVHRDGGIVEHPVGSSLFREHGSSAGVIVRVNQGDFGHQALKPTMIYCVRSKT
jgi:hypothetical protein